MLCYFRVRNTALNYRVSKLQLVETDVKTQFKKKLNQCHVMNNEVNTFVGFQPEMINSRTYKQFFHNVHKNLVKTLRFKMSK